MSAVFDRPMFEAPMNCSWQHYDNEGLAINSAGAVVGLASNGVPMCTGHAILWSNPTSPMDLGEAYPSAINDAGEVLLQVGGELKVGARTLMSRPAPRCRGARASTGEARRSVRS